MLKLLNRSKTKLFQLSFKGIKNNSVTQILGEFASMMVRSRSCWWKASVSYHMNLSTMLPECPHDKAVGFPWAGGPRESQDEAVCFLKPWIRNHTWLLLPHPSHQKPVTKDSLHSGTERSASIFLKRRVSEHFLTYFKTNTQ